MPQMTGDPMVTISKLNFPVFTIRFPAKPEQGSSIYFASYKRA
jgi:hypothetical protein